MDFAIKNFLIFLGVFLLAANFSQASEPPKTTAPQASTASWTADPEITSQLASDPSLLKRKLESAMRHLLKDPKSLVIELTEITASETSCGILKKVLVKTERGEIDHLILDRAEFDFNDVQLDTTQLIKEEKIRPVVVNTINLDVVILESDLNSFLQVKAKHIKVDEPNITLTPGILELSGSTKYSFMKVKFSATGGIRIHNNKEIWFHPQKIKLNSMAMPRPFIGTIVKRINPVLNLEKFPFRLNLREIKVEQGALHFTSMQKD